MKRSFRILSLGSLLAIAASASAVDVYGVAFGTTTNLVRFDSAAPDTYAQNVAITGVATGDRLVGLDFRSNGGALYALGYNGTTGAGNIYTLDRNTGAVLTTTALSTGLVGNAFGVDFNPAADRLRIVSNSGQDLRVDVSTGAATVDGTLRYASGDVNAASQPSIVAVGYTNNFLGAGAGRATTLYDIDSSLDTLATQNPPNDGVLATIGNLGVNLTSLSDMDIYFDGTNNIAFFSANPVGSVLSSFYTLNLGTGQATLVGNTAAGSRLGLIAATPVPEPASLAALAVGAVALLRRRRKA